MAVKSSVAGSVQDVVMVPVSEIADCPSPVRFEYAEQDILELAASIAQVGLLQPILVRIGKKGYEVVAGQRRLLACRRAGVSEIPCMVREESGGESALLAMTENLVRRDMNVVEEAVACAKWMQETGQSAEVLAERLGRDRSYVSKRVAILDMDEGTLGALANGAISLHHALELRRVEDPSTRAYLLDAVVKNGASVAVLKGWVEQYTREGESAPGVDLGREERPTGPDVPLPRIGCRFCGRGTDEVMLSAVMVCRDCDAELRRVAAGVEQKNRS